MKTDFSDLLGNTANVVLDNIPTMSVESVIDKFNIVDIDPIAELEAEKPKKKAKKRKRCTTCDSMIAIDIFDDPEKHPCIKPLVPVEEESEPYEPAYTKEVASQNLYNLQFTTYFIIENALKQAGKNEMDGLTGRMEEMRDQYLAVFEQIYDEKGSEFLDNVLSPTLLWAMLTAQNVGITYIENKKKE